MKKFICLTTLIIMVFGCTNEIDAKKEETTSLAKIIGPDSRQCICCGGYIITIDDVAYRFHPQELPDNDLNLSLENLPLQITIEWENNQDAECGDLITILHID